MTIVITMTKLMVAMILGFVMGKIGIITNDVRKSLSSMVINVTSPALILYSVTTTEHGDNTTVLTLLGFGVLMYLITPVIGYVVARAMRVDQDLRGMYLLFLTFANTAFMGFPVVQALFGDEAIFYTTILHFPFNLLMYSFGLFVIARDAGETTRVRVKDVLTPGVISAVLALVVYFANISLPAVVTEPLSFVGNVTMPMSMMIIGASMAGYSLKDILGEKDVYLMAVMRLAILPLLTYLFVRMFTENRMIINVATVTFGMPVAAAVAMGSAKYEKQGRVGTVAVALTTICSMVTIPIMALLLGI